MTRLRGAVNPFFAGLHADWLSILPYAVLIVLYRAGARKPLG
ncbi:MAG: hypothetical protein Q8M88_02640 [Phenylobacterium sp.]|nr:hypothetical protein [Phenylobacterium sp.]MDP3173316.1 hypothetical protein [Phenylobacterium sp.]